MNEQSNTQISPEYAGFWRRFCAIIIDFIVLIIIELYI